MTPAATPPPASVPVFRILTAVCLAVIVLNGVLVFWLVVRQADSDERSAVRADLTSSAILLRDLANELGKQQAWRTAIIRLAGLRCSS